MPLLTSTSSNANSLSTTTTPPSAPATIRLKEPFTFSPGGWHAKIRRTWPCYGICVKAHTPLYIEDSVMLVIGDPLVQHTHIRGLQKWLPPQNRLAICFPSELCLNWSYGEVSPPTFFLILVNLWMYMELKVEYCLEQFFSKVNSSRVKIVHCLKSSLKKSGSFLKTQRHYIISLFKTNLFIFNSLTPMVAYMGPP